MESEIGILSSRQRNGNTNALLLMKLKSVVLKEESPVQKRVVYAVSLKF